MGWRGYLIRNQLGLPQAAPPPPQAVAAAPIDTAALERVRASWQARQQQQAPPMDATPIDRAAIDRVRASWAARQQAPPTPPTVGGPTYREGIGTGYGSYG
jgi:hypothetical protein